jgi:hypothetical protein
LLGRYRDVCGEINDSILKSVLGFHTAREKQPYIIYARDCRSRPPPSSRPVSEFPVRFSPRPLQSAFQRRGVTTLLPIYPPLNDGKRFRKCSQFIAVATVVVGVGGAVGKRREREKKPPYILYTAHLPVYDRIFVKQ